MGESVDGEGRGISVLRRVGEVGFGSAVDGNLRVEWRGGGGGGGGTERRFDVVVVVV